MALEVRLDEGIRDRDEPRVGIRLGRRIARALTGAGHEAENSQKKDASHAAL
jgi:hypothetical protein